MATTGLEDAMRDAAALLSGTGWASTLEHRARKLARGMGIRSVAVIDHWTNYKARFIRDGELVLPDELWVADDDARAEAARCFPHLAVRQLPNLYLDGMLREISACNPQPALQIPRNILYVLEPIRQKWGLDDRPGELQAFDFFMEYLTDSGLSDAVRICLRPHPSDASGKYNEWPSRYAGAHVTVDSATPLSHQIAQADWVVGCESFALVIAMHAGRVVISTLPPAAPQCSLPHRGLRHLRDMVRPPA